MVGVGAKNENFKMFLTFNLVKTGRGRNYSSELYKIDVNTAKYQVSTLQNTKKKCKNYGDERIER